MLHSRRNISRCLSFPILGTLRALLLKAKSSRKVQWKCNLRGRYLELGRGAPCGSPTYRDPVAVRQLPKCKWVGDLGMTQAGPRV